MRAVPRRRAFSCDPLLGASICLAALVSHVAVDALGDVALTHDAYDDLPHGSRAVVTIGIAVLLTLLARIAMRGAFGARCSAAKPSEAWPRIAVFAGVTAIGGLVAMMAMEALDALFAGRVELDPVDLLAGAPVFAASVSLTCGILCALALRLTTRFAHTVARRLVAVVVSLVARLIASPPLAQRRASRRSRTAAAHPVGRRASKRGPPLPA